MFLHHPLLGRNLHEITMAMLTIDGKSAEEILGGIDALKFRSLMTLFDNICPNDIFSDALQKYYDGKVDERTLEMLQTGKVGDEQLISGGIIGGDYLSDCVNRKLRCFSRSFFIYVLTL